MIKCYYNKYKEGLQIPKFYVKPDDTVDKEALINELKFLKEKSKKEASERAVYFNEIELPNHYPEEIEIIIVDNYD